MSRPKGPPKKEGRPPKTLNFEEFDKLCALQCTIPEFECYFDMDQNTINAICLREKGLSFSALFEQKRQNGKMSLRRRLFWKAMNSDSDAALIFLSKQPQYLNFADQTKTTVVEDLSEEAKFLSQELQKALKK